MIKRLTLILALLIAAPVYAQYVRDDCTTVAPAATFKGTCYDYNSGKFKYWNGSAWVDVAGGGGGGSGDVVGPSASVDSEVALFSGTTGKLLKRAVASGVAKLTSGVLGTATAGSDYENPLTFSSPLSRSTNTISCLTASGSQAGCLSSADWTTFNGKQVAGNYITALTGDVTASGPGSVAATIANAAVTLAKIQNAAANSKLLGSGASGSGSSYVEITLGTNLSMSGATLNASGGGTGCTTSGTSILKGDGAGGCANASAGTEYAAAPTGSANTPLFNNGSGGFTNGTRSGNTTQFVTTTGTLTSGDCVKIDASGNFIANGSACGGGGGGTVYFSDPGLRLTLTTGVAITTSDVTAAGTLYYTPYKSCKVTVKISSTMTEACITEINLSLTLTSGKNYDVFVACSNATTCTLSLSSAWTNDTTRADALATETLCGCTVLSSDHTKLWIGTIRASGTNTTEDSVLNRFVDNAFNGVPRNLLFQTVTDTFAYNSSTWITWGGGTAQVSWVSGTATKLIRAEAVAGQFQSGSNFEPQIAIGLNSTSTPTSTGLYNTTFGVTISPLFASYGGFGGLGYNFAAMLMRSANGVDGTFLGAHDGATAGLSGWANF